MKRLIIPLLILLFLAGCAGEYAYVSNSTQSKALNVMRAAGAMEIDDHKVTEADLGDYGKQGSGWVGGWSTFGLLTGGIEGGIMHGFWATGEEAPENVSGIIAWMPKDLASSPAQAQRKMIEVLQVSLQKALLEVPLPEGYKAEAPRLESQANPNVISTITGQECSVDSVVCRYLIGAPKEPRQRLSPDFLGGRDAWAWTFDGDPNVIMIGMSSFMQMTPKPVQSYRLPDLKLYQKFSANLPEWVYIYLSPVNPRHSPFLRVTVETDQGFGPLQSPIVINRGEIYTFISKM